MLSKNPDFIKNSTSSGYSTEPPGNLGAREHGVTLKEQKVVAHDLPWQNSKLSPKCPWNEIPTKGKISEMSPVAYKGHKVLKVRQNRVWTFNNTCHLKNQMRHLNPKSLSKSVDLCVYSQEGTSPSLPVPTTACLRGSSAHCAGIKWKYAAGQLYPH